MFRSAETQILISTIFGFISWIMYILYNCSDHRERRKNLSVLNMFLCEKMSLRSKSIENTRALFYAGFLVFEIVFFSLLQILPGPTGFTIMLGKLFGTDANYLGIVILGLVVISISCVILWVNPIMLFDSITPSYALALVFIKLSCSSAGCCHGMYYEQGFFNYKYGRPEVPIQLIEAGVAGLLFVFLLFYKRNAKSGTMMPMYIMTYSGTRFFTEFLRGEENILGPLKNYHIQCLVFFIFGLILYVLAIKLSDKIISLFETTTYFKKGALHEKVVAMREDIINTDYYKKPKDKAQKKNKRKTAVK